MIQSYKTNNIAIKKYNKSWFGNHNFMGKFATGHRYFMTFAEIYRSIMFLLDTVTICGTFTRTHHITKNGKFCTFTWETFHF
jgi:hypothetical protein